MMVCDFTNILSKHDNHIFSLSDLTDVRDNGKIFCNPDNDNARIFTSKEGFGK